ncbi:MAG: PilZ domain-containing protein [Myxococcales bacterium FL481]|nr:MAG: PilZ domain-containing protein [Myxococcales bacterium FL481]
MNMSERRQNQRHTVQLAVELEFSGQQLECASADVSIGGIRLVLPDGFVLGVGDRVDVKFRLPALEATVSAPAVVRWVDRIDERSCGLQFTVGLRAREVWAINCLFDAAM